MTHDRLNAVAKILQRDAILQLIRLPVYPALPVAGQIEHSFADRLARDRPSIYADPAADRFTLQDHYALSQSGSLDRGMMTRWAGTNHHQIVIKLGHRITPSRRTGVMPT